MSADKYPSIFSRQMATIVYIVSLRGTNTIASRDQFRPIRIGETSLVNYNTSIYVKAGPHLRRKHKHKHKHKQLMC